MPRVAANSMWSGPLALALALATVGGVRAQQPELPTPGQAPAAPGDIPGQAQQAPPEQAAPAEEEQAQTIAPQPAPQVLFGQPGYGVGGFGAVPNYLDLDLGLAYTDNALLSPIDRMSTGIGTVGFLTNYSYVGGDLDIIARGNIDWLEYFDNAFPGKAYGAFNGTAMWGHPTDLLQWVVEETYTDGQADPLASPTPDFVEEVNYFTTGPYLNFNFGATDRLTFYGLYSNTAFETSPFSSNTIDGGTSFTHGLSSLSSVSLLVDSAYNSFESSDFASGNPDVASNNPNVASEYNMRTARVLYNAMLARTRLSVSAGYAIEDYGGAYSGSPIATVDLSRQISDSQSISLHGNYGYTTFGNAARSNIGAPTSPTTLTGGTPALATAAPYKDHLISAGWNFARARTSFSLLGSFDRQSYADESALDNKVEDVTATLTRALQPTLSVGLQATQSWRQYGELDNAQVTLTIIRLSLSKEFRKLGVSLYVQRADQAYSGAAAPLGFVATGSYTEDRVGLEFTYDLLGQRTAGTVLPAIL